MKSTLSLSLLILNFAFANADTASVTARYDEVVGFPLQKTQFGLSYIPNTDDNHENVFEILKARNVRNNDKRLRRTWDDWDGEGKPVYGRDDYLMALLEGASDHGAVGGGNLQGPYEHPSSETYRLSSQVENIWDWDRYSRDSMLYFQRLRENLSAYGADGYPFVFGIGHESNNDCGLESLGITDGCQDGLAFMGNFNDFYDLAITQGRKAEGDLQQAGRFFEWYRKTIDAIASEIGPREDFQIALAQPHTNSSAVTDYLAELKRLIDENAAIYKPDYIGSHARWNLPGQERFFRTIVEPSRAIFARDTQWQAAPIMCNEFGASDNEESYMGTLTGAVQLLGEFEKMLMSPDIGYVNFIYNNRFAFDRGRRLYPAFHAFRFYQDMPVARTRLQGDWPEELRILSSRDANRQMALFWTDQGMSEALEVDFAFDGMDEGWEAFRVSAYRIMSENPDQEVSSAKSGEDFGFAEHLLPGYPKTIHDFSDRAAYEFDSISMPPASLVMLKLERMDDAGSILHDFEQINSGPEGALLVKQLQWAARHEEGGVDRAWGFSDTKTWTLYAGVEDANGIQGSVTASYLNGEKVARGLAGLEFRAASPVARLKVSSESRGLNPEVRDLESIAAVRIDFYNGTEKRYDASLVLTGNRFPDPEDYHADYVPWGHGGVDTSVLPSTVERGIVFDGTNKALDLDAQYVRLTERESAEDFVVGGRRVIVSAWIENWEGDMTVEIADRYDNETTSIEEYPALGVERAVGGNLKVSWIERRDSRLETSVSPKGPWQEVNPEPISPMSLELASEQKRFYRLRRE